MYSRISVQETDFNVGHELELIRQQTSNYGAISSFIGVVRNSGDCQQVEALELEHCCGVTEKVLAEIAQQAAQKFALAAVCIIHRVGKINLAEQIVLVACAAAHRRAAFDATDYIMDILKSTAPFWKKEFSAGKQQWVKAKQYDADSLERW